MSPHPPDAIVNEPPLGMAPSTEVVNLKSELQSIQCVEPSCSPLPQAEKTVSSLSVFSRCISCHSAQLCPPSSLVINKQFHPKLTVYSSNPENNDLCYGHGCKPCCLPLNVLVFLNLHLWLRSANWRNTWCPDHSDVNTPKMHRTLLLQNEVFWQFVGWVTARCVTLPRSQIWR